jgi:hypothetical protein
MAMHAKETSERSRKAEQGLVKSSCLQFLREAIRAAAQEYQNQELPQQVRVGMVWEPSGPGRYTGKEIAFPDLDMDAVWQVLDTDNEATQSLRAAVQSLEHYIAAHDIRPSGMWTHQVDRHYLSPLLAEYLAGVGNFTYQHAQANLAANDLVKHLDAEDVDVLGLVALEGLAADRPFTLQKNIHIRPISESDLQLAAYQLPPRLQSGHSRPLTPRMDWWICEARVGNPRGTADGWNRMHEIADAIRLTLRAFKPGGVSVGLITSQLSSPFGRVGHIWGGRLDSIAVNAPPYSLSSAEIPNFVKLWRRIAKFTEEPDHYLHVPIRRLRSAGTRVEMEDALVDYVVGLEALLGTADERTELSYRFRVRGSVILAPTRSARRRHLTALQDLYGLRSRIVHGERVESTELESALPVAEDALRLIWRWYFDNWYEEKSNRTAIRRIDELLVG